MDNDGLQVYFTSTGLTYKMEEWGKSAADQKRLKEIVERERSEKENPSKREIKEEDELKRLDILRSSVIQLEWVSLVRNNTGRCLRELDLNFLLPSARQSGESFR